MPKLTSSIVAITLTAAVLSLAAIPAQSDQEFQLAQLPMQQTDDPYIQKMLDASVADAPLTWDVPQGWNEVKGSGMRMATFTPASGEAVECSVISLRGTAGGIEGNIQRWMTQIDLSMPPAAFQAYMDDMEMIATRDGHKVFYVDLAQFQKGQSDDATSMIAAILQLPTQTVFFKMLGPLGSVKENDTRLRELIQSVAVNPALK